MHDAMLMRILQRLAKLQPQVDHLLPGQNLFLREHVVERVPLDKLHREILNSLRLPHRQETHDVLMAKLLQDLRLALKSIGRAPLPGSGSDDHFHGRRPSRLDMRRAINFAHRA